MPMSTTASTASATGSIRFRSLVLVTRVPFAFSVGECDHVHAEVEVGIGDRSAAGKVGCDEGHEVTGELVLLAGPLDYLVDDEGSPADDVKPRARVGGVEDGEHEDALLIGRVFERLLDAVLFAGRGGIVRVDGKEVLVAVLDPVLDVVGTHMAVAVEVEETELALRRIKWIVLAERDVTDWPKQLGSETMHASSL